jgi:hypothetical protein
MLTTGAINMEVVDVDPDSITQCIAQEVCPNGPEVPVCVDKMVNDAYNVLFVENPA